MMNQKPLRNIFLLLTALLSITSCEIKGNKKKHKGVIEMNKTMPGIYQGTIVEVSAHQRVAYLQTTTDQILELTFKSDSVLTEDSKKLPLNKLNKGSNVKVTLKKKNDINMEIESFIILN